MLDIFFLIEYYLDTTEETVNEGNGPLRITIRRTVATGDGDVRKF